MWGNAVILQLRGRHRENKRRRRLAGLFPAANADAYAKSTTMNVVLSIIIRTQYAENARLAYVANLRKAGVNPIDKVARIRTSSAPIAPAVVAPAPRSTIKTDAFNENAPTSSVCSGHCRTAGSEKE